MTHGRNQRGKVLASDIVCDAALFADRVITEINGKKGVIGVFDRFNFPGFPATAPPFFIFVMLRNIPQGERAIAINLVSEKNQVMLSIPGELNITEPRGKIEVVFPIQGMAFHKAGTYDLMVYVDGKFIHGKPLFVNEAPTEQRNE